MRRPHPEHHLLTTLADHAKHHIGVGGQVLHFPGEERVALEHPFGQREESGGFGLDSRCVHVRWARGPFIVTHEGSVCWNFLQSLPPD